MHKAELIRNLPHRNVGGAEKTLHPRIGGYRVVPRNDPADRSENKSD